MCLSSWGLNWTGIHIENLKDKLLERKYPEDMIENQIVRIKSKKRKYLHQKKQQKSIAKLRLILTHKEKNSPIHQLLRQGRELLEKNEKDKEIGQNIQIAYKWCSRWKCHACPILSEAKTFQITNTRKIFQIKQKGTRDIN